MRISDWSSDVCSSDLHAHLDLLGWISTSLIGLAAARYPLLTEGRLAVAQFWLYNLGVPVFLLALAADLGGYPQAQPVAAGALMVVALSLVLLACPDCLCIKGRYPSTKSASKSRALAT